MKSSIVLLVLFGLASAQHACQTNVPTFPHSVCGNIQAVADGYFVGACNCTHGWTNRNSGVMIPIKCMTGTWKSGGDYCIYPTADCIDYTCTEPAVLTTDEPPLCRVTTAALSSRRLECNPDDPNCGTGQNQQEQFLSEGGSSGGGTYYCPNEWQTLVGSNCVHTETPFQGTCTPPGPPQCDTNTVPITGGWCNNVVDGHAECGCYWGSHSELGVPTFTRECDPLENTWTNAGTCSVCKDQAIAYIDGASCSQSYVGGQFSAECTCDSPRLYSGNNQNTFALGCDHQNGWEQPGSCNMPDCSYMPGSEWMGTSCGCPSGTFESNGACEAIPTCACGASWDQMYNTCICNALPDMTWDGTQCLDVEGNPYTSCTSVCVDGYVLDTATNQCVSSCPDTMFLLNANCYAECPAPYLGDEVSRVCTLECPTTLFTDNVSNRCVSACVTPRFSDAETMTCVDSCVDKYTDTAMNACRACEDVLSGSSWDTAQQACKCASQFVDGGAGACVHYNTFYCGHLANSNWDGTQCVCPAGTYDDGTGACVAANFCGAPALTTASCVAATSGQPNTWDCTCYAGY